MASGPLPRIFLGSSSEGREVARNLQAELGETADIVRWDQSVFEPGGYTLDSLLSIASTVDFAVLVASPDDTTSSRGDTNPSARDNVVLEFGLFAGVIGRRRTYLLATGPLKLPTDVLGLTRLPFRQRPDGNLRAAVSDAALHIEERVRSLGPLPRESVDPSGQGVRSILDREIELLCNNAVSQGWTIKKNDQTTLRLAPSRGKRAYTLIKRTDELTRSDLRYFSATLRAVGLRVNSAIRGPVEQSPYQ